MPVSKKHHYVPKAILREFCISGETILRLERSKKAGEPELKNIDRVFQRFHLNNYETISGEKDDQLEKFFANELDNFIPEWIKIFSEASDLGKLRFPNPRLRFSFIQFFYNHMKRNPDFIDPIVESVSGEIFHDNIEYELEDKLGGLTQKERRLLHDQQWREMVISNSRVQNFSKQSKKILNILANMEIIVAKPKDDRKQFIVSSNPVARFENYIDQHLGTPGVEMWTTLTPKIAVGFTIADAPSDVILLCENDVRKLNQCLTKNSTAIAGRSAKLLKSLGRIAW